MLKNVLAEILLRENAECYWKNTVTQWILSRTALLSKSVWKWVVRRFWYSMESTISIEHLTVPGIIIHEIKLVCLKCHWLPCSETTWSATREHAPSKDSGQVSCWFPFPTPNSPVKWACPQGSELDFQIEKVRLPPASLLHTPTLMAGWPGPVPGIQDQVPVCGIEEWILTSMLKPFPICFHI